MAVEMRVGNFQKIYRAVSARASRKFEIRSLLGKQTWLVWNFGFCRHYWIGLHVITPTCASMENE